MKFNVQKILQALPLSEYDKAYSGESLQVWVNPPRASQIQREELDRKYEMMARTQILAERERERRMAEATDQAARDQILAEAETALEQFRAGMKVFAAENYAWFAELWSQSPDTSTHWTVEEIGELFEQEPALCSWLGERTQALLKEHREQQKKG
jgi:hypothetical protein